MISFRLPLLDLFETAPWLYLLSLWTDDPTVHTKQSMFRVSRVSTEIEVFVSVGIDWMLDSGWGALSVTLICISL